jgi:hypothetical protein
MARAEYEEVAAIDAAKRCGVQWSPRNDNNNAEGTWDHWVDLAVKILQDPMTALVRPEAHELAKGLETKDFYDESSRCLTDAELEARFPDKDK